MKSIEKWACQTHKICLGAYINGVGSSIGDTAALKQFVKEEIDEALKDLTMDFEIMESSTVRRSSTNLSVQKRKLVYFSIWHAV